jgi:hypothetical protein
MRSAAFTARSHSPAVAVLMSLRCAPARDLETVRRGSRVVFGGGRLLNADRPARATVCPLRIAAVRRNMQRLPRCANNGRASLHHLTSDCDAGSSSVDAHRAFAIVRSARITGLSPFAGRLRHRQKPHGPKKLSMVGKRSVPAMQLERKIARPGSPVHSG